jgi:hypothetical protein
MRLQAPTLKPEAIAGDLRELTRGALFPFYLPVTSSTSPVAPVQAGAHRGAVREREP